ncbi:toxin-antitoxin system TumE family protein [Halocatena marina]|uniref:toxin-antitoxin system TumE family protein n=1 Tax=Halocatena marina TaxID=2934937 RepID=UPI00200EA74B|nr:DUF6516 family protein [Halocatena marina]
MVPAVTEDELDGYRGQQRYPDDTVVRVFCMRTTDETYASGWAYKLHYGVLEPTEETLDDGTIRRYDNSHEDTKGHELHVAPDPEPEIIEFPGMVELWNRFWTEVPNDEFEVP